MHTGHRVINDTNQGIYPPQDLQLQGGKTAVKNTPCPRILVSPINIIVLLFTSGRTETKVFTPHYKNREDARFHQLQFSLD